MLQLEDANDSDSTWPRRVPEEFYPKRFLLSEEFCEKRRVLKPNSHAECRIQRPIGDYMYKVGNLDGKTAGVFHVKEGINNLS